jgi:hypothetical protein
MVEVVSGRPLHLPSLRPCALYASPSLQCGCKPLFRCIFLAYLWSLRAPWEGVGCGRAVRLVWGGEGTALSSFPPKSNVQRPAPPPLPGPLPSLSGLHPLLSCACASVRLPCVQPRVPFAVNSTGQAVGPASPLPFVWPPCRHVARPFHAFRGGTQGTMEPPSLSNSPTHSLRCSIGGSCDE